MKVAVIGGGASGMMAALSAAEQGAEVTLLERQARLGRKLAATGNGRCNLTNLHASPMHYHGEAADFCAAALSRAGVRESLARFREMGLLTVTETDGRVYPMSDNAGSVVDVLRFSLNAAGILIRCGCAVDRLEKRKDGFRLYADCGEFEADSVVVACGGKAGGKLGGVPDGYRLLEGCGHHCTKLSPALVQLRTAGSVTRGLKGVRTQARVRVLRNGRLLAEETGEVQFTEYGLSGPAIFSVSREAVIGGECSVILDLFPALSAQELCALLAHRAETRPGLTAEDLFTGTVQNRLGRVLVSSAGISGALALREVKTRLPALAEWAKSFTFRVTGDLGFDQAQVTAGGIRTAEFDPLTLESRLCSGLYACGEVLDIDGDCGGYNLQWAWSSGTVAGINAGRGGKPC